MQKMRFQSKSLSRILCMVLLAAMTLFAIGCTDNTQQQEEQGTLITTAHYEDGEILGEGEKEFTFTVTDEDGIESTFTIHTDREFVGDALFDVNMIDGEAGEYGLYVKMVNGILAAYEINNKYWAFYVDGEYAMSGVDTTKIVEGSVYSFKVE